MKVIKYLLLLILLILIGGGLYILISNKDYRIEEGINLPAPRELVFDQIKNLKEWQNWVSVNQKDLNLSFSHKNDAEQSYLTWEDSSTGFEGKLSHHTLTHYASLQQKAESQSGWGGHTQYEIDWEFHKIGEDSTRIDVAITAHPNFINKVKRILNIINNQRFIETRTPTSLQNIERLVQQKMAVYHLTIEGIVHRSSPQNYMYRTKASANEPDLVMKRREEILTLLRQQLDSLKINPTGSALMVYNSVDKKNKNLIFSAGYPISSSVHTDSFGENDPVIGTLDAREYLKATLQGNYSNIPKLWEKTRTYMLQNELTEDPDNRSYEVFKVTSTNSKNPAEWVTELYIPIQYEKLSTVEEINEHLN